MYVKPDYYLGAVTSVQCLIHARVHKAPPPPFKTGHTADP